MGANRFGPLSLYPEDVEALRKEVMVPYSLTFSAALRFALREWRITRGADLDYDKKLAGRIARSLRKSEDVTA